MLKYPFQINNCHKDMNTFLLKENCNETQSHNSLFGPHSTMANKKADHITTFTEHYSSHRSPKQKTWWETKGKSFLMKYIHQEQERWKRERDGEKQRERESTMGLFLSFVTSYFPTWRHRGRNQRPLVAKAAGALLVVFGMLWPVCHYHVPVWHWVCEPHDCMEMHVCLFICLLVSLFWVLLISVLPGSFSPAFLIFFVSVYFDVVFAKVQHYCVSGVRWGRRRERRKGRGLVRSITALPPALIPDTTVCARRWQWPKRQRDTCQSDIHYKIFTI